MKKAFLTVSLLSLLISIIAVVVFKTVLSFVDESLEVEIMVLGLWVMIIFVSNLFGPVDFLIVAKESYFLNYMLMLSFIAFAVLSFFLFAKAFSAPELFLYFSFLILIMSWTRHLLLKQYHGIDSLII